MKIDGIDLWLTTKRTTPTGQKYSHQSIKEDPTKWQSVFEKLCGYFREAHDDVISHMRTLAGVSLHPSKKKKAVADPATNYPFRLHETVLKGYFGEVFAGALTEAFSPGGYDDWEIPAFLFRNHAVAFQHLERCRQTGDTPGPIPGRLGDDFLAFRRRDKKVITTVLYGEAKCTAQHHASMIADAHEKLACGAVVDVLQLIEILSDRGGDAEADAWVASLRELHARLPSGKVERIDCVVYVHGQEPVQSDTWIPSQRPHKKYGTTGRHLEAIEVLLTDVDGKVKAVYAERVWKP